MAHKKTLEDLSSSDERILKGFEDPIQEEEEQIIPISIQVSVKTPEEKNVDDLKEIKNRAEVLLERISSLQKEIDSRCKDLSVTVIEEESSDNDLLKAMWRVFKEKTKTVTYKHYTKALELRERLAKEDEGRLKEL